MNALYIKNFKKYFSKASRLLKDNERAKPLLTDAVHKLKSLIESNESLKEFSERILIFFRMFRAQLNGDYTELPFKTLTMMVGAIIYFVTPVDMIPDFLPALGLTDDVAVVYWVYNNLKQDIANFKQWENTIEIEEVNEN